MRWSLHWGVMDGDWRGQEGGRCLNISKSPALAGLCFLFVAFALHLWRLSLECCHVVLSCLLGLYYIAPGSVHLSGVFSSVVSGFVVSTWLFGQLFTVLDQRRLLEMAGLGWVLSPGLSEWLGRSYG